MIKAGSWISLMALLFLSACMSNPIDCELHMVTTVPLEVHNRLLVVPAGINGKWVRLLVDTGAERTALSTTTADRLGLARDQDNMTKMTGVGGTYTAHDAIIPGLVLGGWRFPLERLPVNHLRLGPGLEVDGLLGADVLLAYDLDINVPEQTLTLYRPRRCPDIRPPWTERADRVPGVRTFRDRLLIPLSLDGVEGMAILDTGAQATTIGRGMAVRLGLTQDILSRDRVVEQHGAGPGSTAARLHRFTQLQVGPARAINPVLAVMPNDIGAGDALVGEDFINGHRIWMSFSNREVFISGLESEPAP
jgi:predicted aspartyl protease